MNTKLTLSLDKNVINEAKKYAKIRHKSISKMIENYLKNVVNKDEVDDLSPIVNELAGSIKNIKSNFKDEYTNYLIKKYK
jgi:hypothetical protein